MTDTVVDHPVVEFDAELRMPGQPVERVRVMARYPREGKLLVAFPRSSDPRLDIGEIGATVRVPESMVTVRPAR